MKEDPLLGSVLADRFELVAFAGAGGMGHVYRARDRATGADVALKVLLGDGDVARFAREAQVLASLDHPGIVRHVAHGVTGEGWQYLAMEWLTGEDLGQRLERGSLSVAETVLVAAKVAEPLRAAHDRGIVHRDLKPANLFLADCRLEDVKLLDFGIARTVEGAGLTASGIAIGTPSYMAPEQVRGSLVDARTDIYGLGGVMFRCLVGQPPFSGAHQIAVLAKIVLEPAPRVRTLRPDVPAALEDLVARMLDKEPDRRPSSCAALLDELRGIDASRAPPSGRASSVISAEEQRVATVVLCARSADHEITRPDAQTLGGDHALFGTIRERGGVIDALARGAWLVTIPGTASPAEQALQATRCAMALAAARPGSAVYVATGRVLVHGGQTMGEVIDRAAAALVQASAARADGVWIDAATADLVEGRFRMEAQGPWYRLEQEVEAVAPTRLLLGKPTPCVGREPQLAMLSTLLDSVLEQGRASCVVVSAPAGLGKTHLVHEFLRTRAGAGTGAPALDVLVGRGDAARAASPWGLVGRVLRRAAGILETDAEASRGRKLAALVESDLPDVDGAWMREVLGEVCGVHTPADDASTALRSARGDPSVMADAVREAWTDWVGARAARGPVLLLVEDAHWADAPSAALVEDALIAHADLPILLLSTARPGTVKWDRLRAAGLVEIALAPLPASAAEALVRSTLGLAAAEDLVRSVARRAAGHPFYLEQLLHAVVAGRGPDALPDSVLGMVQARFDDLDARARRVLRAGSVFGETFWSGAVASLLGDDVSDGEMPALLGSLVRAEIVTRQRTSRWRGQVEYRFRHALLRDGAYATLTDADRARAHRHAAAWLEEAGEQDPAVLADHYDRGGAVEQAVERLGDAARLALHRNDFERAMAHATRARALGAGGSAEAALCAVEAEVLYWRGDLAAAAERATDAAGKLERGLNAWFDAASVAIGAHGQLGRNDAVAARLEDVADAVPRPEARGAQVVALARGMTQLFWAHHGGALERVRGRLDVLAEDAGALDAFPAGWVQRVRGESAWLHDRDVGRCLGHLSAACDCFERSHARRALCLTQLNAATLSGWAGAPGEGLDLAARAQAEATRLGSEFLLCYGRAVQGLLMTYAGLPEAAATMREAMGKLGGSPRLSFVARLALGWLALERGDVAEAQAHADALAVLPVARELRPAGLAIAARTRLARGLLEEADELARRAVAEDSATTDLDLPWGIAGVALAEVSFARGDEAAARAALEPVVRGLAALALTIEAPEQRQGFWRRPLPNANVRQLAERLGLRVSA